MLSTNIKEATKAAHQDLEKKVVLKLKAIRSNADYADLLKHFYAYFGAVEEAIADFITIDVLPDYLDRRHASALKHDIESLGGDASDLPEVSIPEITNILQALGALYVMEGSIMGGSIIVQMLAKGGITEGVSFFSGYGAATGEMWGKFVGVMNANGQTETQQQEVIDSANDTFAQFSEVFGAVKVFQ